MRLKTIWTLRGMSFLERLRRTRETAAFAVAGWLPLRVKYWVTMRMLGLATADSPNVPATPLDEVLKKLPKPKVVA